MPETYTDMQVDPAVVAAIEAFQLPDPLGFGVCMAPVMYRANYSNGEWQQGCLTPYAPVALWPGAKALQYAASVFEGMKAYRVDQECPNLFRPEVNHQRLNASARTHCMPEIPETLFFQAIHSVVGALHKVIPEKSGQSLYLRPFLIGTQDGLGLGRSDTYSFMVIASPCEDFHAGPMKVRIMREQSRVPFGKLGSAKAGSNYAASLGAGLQARTEGFDQVLWLDTAGRVNVEELSGMNVFFKVGDCLYTPSLTGSILAGVTRDSVIKLAKKMGVTVVASALPIDGILRQISAGDCSEAFACGTAAGVSPISAFGDGDTLCNLPDCPGDLTMALKQQLLAIQERREPDPFGWVKRVPMSYCQPVVVTKGFGS